MVETLLVQVTVIPNNSFCSSAEKQVFSLCLVLVDMERTSSFIVCFAGCNCKTPWSLFHNSLTTRNCLAWLLLVSYMQHPTAAGFIQLPQGDEQTASDEEEFELTTFDDNHNASPHPPEVDSPSEGDHQLSLESGTTFEELTLESLHHQPLSNCTTLSPPNIIPFTQYIAINSKCTFTHKSTCCCCLLTHASCYLHTCSCG